MNCIGNLLTMNLISSHLKKRIAIFCYLFKNKRGSPLVEESILLGLSLFAFMILATIVFDLVDFAKNIFTEVTNGLDKIPG